MTGAPAEMDIFFRISKARSIELVRPVANPYEKSRRSMCILRLAPSNVGEIRPLMELKAN